MNDKTYERVSYKNRQRIWNIVESQYVIHIVLAIAVLTVLIPLVWELLTSFKTNQAVYNLSYFPHDPTLSTYYQVLIEKRYWKAVLNSVIISSVTTVVVIVLAVPAGYVFSRFHFRGDNVLFIAVLFSRLFPPIGLIVPYYKILSTLDILNTLPGIILSQIYLWLPLMIYIMRNFFMSIPADLDESARVDGCTRIQAFRKIALPLALPGIAACSILTFLYSWREFLFSLIVTTDLKSMPISIAVYKFVGDVNVQWASLAAASIIAVIPTVIIVAAFQRYIVSGLTAGAMKE